jgi:hypothetical protein
MLCLGRAVLETVHDHAPLAKLMHLKNIDLNYTGRINKMSLICQLFPPSFPTPIFHLFQS